MTSDFVDVETGEVFPDSHIVTPAYSFADEENYNKTYEINAILREDLSKTALNVLKIIENNLVRLPLTDGYVTNVFLPWDKKNGFTADCHPRFLENVRSQRLFQLGIKELIEENWISRGNVPHSYWLNFNRLFKGDRTLFLQDQKDCLQRLELLKQHTPSGHLPLLASPENADNHPDTPS